MTISPVRASSAPLDTGPWYRVPVGFANERLLCSPAWLVEHSDDEDLVVVDCGWDDSAYRRAHLPGAVFRSGHAYIKGLDAEGNRGLHLPDASDFDSLTAALGIGPGNADKDIL